ERADAESRRVAERGDSFVGQGRGEVVEFAIMGGVLKRKNGDSGLMRQTGNGRRGPFAKEKSGSHSGDDKKERGDCCDGEAQAPALGSIACSRFSNAGFDVALEADEIGFDFRSALVTEVAIFGENFVQDAFEVVREAGAKIGRGYRFGGQDGTENGALCSAVEGASAGSHFIEHRAKREKVGASIEWLAADLFG